MGTFHTKNFVSGRKYSVAHNDNASLWCVGYEAVLHRWSVSLCWLQKDDMPEEVNIDDLIDLPSDEERVRKLQVSQHVDVLNILQSKWERKHQQVNVYAVC